MSKNPANGKNKNAKGRETRSKTKGKKACFDQQEIEASMGAFNFFTNPIAQPPKRQLKRQDKQEKALARNTRGNKNVVQGTKEGSMQMQP